MSFMLQVVTRSGSAPGPANQEPGWAAFEALPQPRLGPSACSRARAGRGRPVDGGSSRCVNCRLARGGRSSAAGRPLTAMCHSLPVPAATVVVPDARAPPDCRPGQPHHEGAAQREHPFSRLTYPGPRACLGKKQNTHSSAQTVHTLQPKLSLSW